MAKANLQKQVYLTYLTLRRTMTWLAIVFPIALFIVGTAQEGELRGSWSAYYYGPPLTMEIFVGSLITIGTCLIVYSGLTPRENWLLSLAGLSAIVVAFVPTNECSANGYCSSHEVKDERMAVTVCREQSAGFTCEIIKQPTVSVGVAEPLPADADVLALMSHPVASGTQGTYLVRYCKTSSNENEYKCPTGPLEWFDGNVSIHGIAALSFFVWIAAVAWFCNRHPGGDLRTRPFYATAYSCLAVLLILLPALALLTNFMGSKIGTFVAETLAAWIFAGYWWIRTAEIDKYHDELKVLEGRELTFKSIGSED